MDKDTINLALQIISALISLAAFVVSLTKATEEERKRVILWINPCVTVVLGIIGSVLFHFGHLEFGLIPFCIIFLLFTGRYIKDVAQGNAPPLYAAATSIPCFGFHIWVCIHRFDLFPQRVHFEAISGNTGTVHITKWYVEIAITHYKRTG